MPPPHTDPSPPTLWSRLDGAVAALRPHRVALSLLADALMVVLAWNATYLFRLGFRNWWSERPAYDLLVLMGVVAIYVTVFTSLRTGRALWRFAGFEDIQRLALGCALAGLASAAVVMGLGLYGIPRAVLALHPFATLIAVSLARLLYRTLYEHAQRQRLGPDAEVRRVLVLGAGNAGKRLVAGIDGQGWNVIGYLDDDPAKRQAWLAGVPVLGTLEQVVQHAAEQAATHIVIAMPRATLEQRRRAFRLAEATPLPVLTVPSEQELRSGRPERALRDIEPEELLGREPVQLDMSGMAQLLEGRVVAVTGGGGSIGSELCRQLAAFGPQRLVVIDHAEYNLFAIEEELRERWPDVPVSVHLLDVCDATHIREVLSAHRPAIVFHAAAYKHVPLLEAANAPAAVRNNVLGTHSAAMAAIAAGAERFVLVSTDKAVNPTNVMGASKRAAELVVAALAREHPATRLMAVRFGNVLGSSGSVIPKFKAQIERGGPVTVTHPEVVRYFMSIPEAARLVLQAAAIGEGGQVLVLDMGEPVKIAELARTMIRLAGVRAQDIEITYTGLRPGEKLYEELLADPKAVLPTPFDAIFIARLDSAQDALRSEEVLAALRLAPGNTPLASTQETVAALQRLLPQYQPSPAAGAPPRINT